MTAYLLEQLVNGLALGSVYALIGIGYSMVYTILYLINFAHGDVIMFGTLVAISALGFGLPGWMALLAGCLTSGLLGLLVERVAYRPVRNANRVVPMLSALGAGLVLSSVAQGIWGAEVVSFPQLIPRGAVHLAGIALPIQPLVMLVVAAVLMVAASVVLEFTRWGRATRCVCQDLVAAQLMGIPVNRLVPAIYAIGGCIGAAGCMLFAMYFNVAWVQMGQLATTKAWAAAMLGGVGNFYGAFVGGLLLGIAEVAAVMLFGSLFKDGTSLAIIAAVLLLRPNGLFGTPTTVRS
jgi:branched-chain amino acid transport system permease protein